MGPPKWTIERETQSKKVYFRCDLALASDYIAPKLKFHYDHSTRSGKEAFTDHSALLIDVPVSTREPLVSVPAEAFHFRPEKTAIHRKEPTTIAKKLVTLIRGNPEIKSALDYGCSYGEDVYFYRRLGLRAEGYDPYPPFGSSKKPSGEFDLVTVIFVLNVLPHPWARLQVLREASQHLARHGIMVVATRSVEEIRHVAEKKGGVAESQ